MAFRESLLKNKGIAVKLITEHSEPYTEIDINQLLSEYNA